MVADLDALKTVPACGKRLDRGRGLAKTIASVEDLEHFELARGRDLLAWGATDSRAGLRQLR